MHCHAGCSFKDIVEKLGFTEADLCGSKRKPRIVKTYDYCNAVGALQYQVVRFDPKDFRQRRPDGNGGWIWNLKGVTKVLYELPKLVSAGIDETVFLPEGEKDADRLRSQGLVATCNSGGAKKWQKGFAKHFRGRHVVLLPDNDEAGKEHVNKVAASIRDVAASVKIVDLPDLPPKGDVSDWLNNGGSKEALIEIVKQSPEWTPSGDKGKQQSESADNEPGLTKLLADAICDDNHFAQDAGGKLYRYVGGVYKSKAEQFVKRRVKALCVELEWTKAWSPKRANDVVEFIRVDSPELWERPPLDKINVRNGLLRLSDRQLLKHSPDHLSTVQLPVAYAPEATCPAIEQFVSEVFPSDAIDLAYEVPANLMRSDTSIQKAVLAIGPGGNGKSVYLRLTTALIGKSNTSSLSLHKLEADKFAASRLYGKLANICPDLPTEHLAGTSVFKAITGGDPITGEYKFRDSFDFVPFARLVFSANNPPRSQDSSQGFFDRWLVIPFDRSFRGTSKEIPSKVLDDRLQAPSELSGLLNKALDALNRIDGKCGFSTPQSVQDAWRDFHATTDPLAVWLDRYTIDDPDALVVKKSLRVAFNAYLERQGRAAMSDKAFGATFGELKPQVTAKQRTVNGRVQWCYVGIGLLHDEKDDSQGSQDSQDSPLINQSQGNQEESRDTEECISGIEQDRANPVNPVNPVDPVKGEDCDKGGHHDWLDSSESDDKVRRFCRKCKRFGGFVQQDGSVIEP